MCQQHFVHSNSKCEQPYRAHCSARSVQPGHLPAAQNAIDAGSPLFLELVLLNQGSAGWKDRGKRQKESANSRPKLCADDPYERGDRSANQKSHHVLRPCSLADAGKIYRDLGHIFASQMNQRPKATTTHTMMEPLLAAKPRTLSRIISQLAQQA